MISQLTILVSLVYEGKYLDLQITVITTYKTELMHLLLNKTDDLLKTQWKWNYNYFKKSSNCFTFVL